MGTIALGVEVFDPHRARNCYYYAFSFYRWTLRTAHLKQISPEKVYEINRDTMGKWLRTFGASEESIQQFFQDNEYGEI